MHLYNHEQYQYRLEFNITLRKLKETEKWYRQYSTYPWQIHARGQDIKGVIFAAIWLSCLSHYIMKLSYHHFLDNF